MSDSAAPTPDTGSRQPHWGREYGPVKEQTFLLSALRRWPLFKTSFLFDN
mgnify:CR=1 FL=1